ncbi:ARM repeat-containing protein [Rickenella mellea]|uniref:ARM repeat-containing protein n=1 Tax=Rickenella mellea TaxID=50990 RepID=A0A4Y7PWM7_9AGAM|nr:ARM repeat-containing protein [Rickenella mellea]
MSSQIAELLAASLQSDPNVRMTAELRLKEVLPNPETALNLSSIIVSQNIDVPVRQMTIIMLRKYVNERWSPYFPSFKGNPPTVEMKTQIRQAVFNGLSDPNSKIRSACAHTLSQVANSDWPDEYPDLLNSLIALLSSASPNSVHGAMQVFSEFIKSDLSEDQILPVLRQLLPVLLSILGSTEYSPLTRARTVSVFRQCVSALFMVKEQHPQAVKEATASVLPVWIEAFKTLLGMDPRADVENTNSWDNLAIRIQIFKTLDTIHISFRQALSSYLNDLLTSSLNHLSAILPTFTHYYLSSSSPSIPNASEEDPIELAQLGCPILDFMSALIRGGKAKAWLEPNLEWLVGTIIGWIQMTSEDEDTWGSDANAFVAQEDDESQQYSLRVAGLDLLSNLMERQPGGTTQALTNVVAQTVLRSKELREAGNAEWWRPLEAALASVGSLSEPLLEFIDDEEQSGRPKPIEIEPLLADVIPSLLSLSECPFLQGRSFVFASQFAKLLPTQLAGRYLTAAVEVIEAEGAGIPIKISAVKAIQNFTAELEDSVLLPIAPRIAKDLGPFLMLTSEDTLSLVLDTLSNIVEIDGGKWITPDLAQALVTATLEVWLKNNKDPIFISILTDILSSLASSPGEGVYQIVVTQSLPPLCNAIVNANPNDSWITSSAVDLIGSLVRGAPEAGLGEGFFGTLAPSLFKCLREAEDRDVLQNGVQCLTWIIRKDVQQLLAWHDEAGQSGIDHVLAVIAKLLNNQDESGGLVIGDLIIHLLRRASSAVIPVLPELLQAMVRRMVTAKTATFVQSLVIPFAFLIHTERDTVVTLLENTNVDGRSGLDILIQTWCENAETFQGFWPTRVSTLGLTQLFVSERPSLQNLIVKGELIVKPETKDVIMTRSKAKMIPHEFTSIPFPVKALKILIHDLQSSGPSAGIAGHNDDVDPDTDDDDAEWADEEKLVQGLKEDEFAFLSDMIGPRGVNFDNDDALLDDDDEDLKRDPVSVMDMTAHLLTFVRECAKRNTNNFASLVDQLSADEMLVMKRIVTEQ